MKNVFLAVAFLAAIVAFAGCPVPIELTVIVPTPSEVVDIVEDVWTPPTEGEGEGEIVVPTEGEGEGEVIIPAEGEGEGEIVVPTEGEGEGEGEAIEHDCFDSSGLTATIGSVYAEPGEIVTVPVNFNQSACMVAGYNLEIGVIEGEAEIVDCSIEEYSNVYENDLLVSTTTSGKLEEILTFRVRISAKADQDIVLGWVAENTQFLDEMADPLDVTVFGGVIYIQ